MACTRHLNPDLMGALVPIELKQDPFAVAERTIKRWKFMQRFPEGSRQHCLAEVHSFETRVAVVPHVPMIHG